MAGSRGTRRVWIVNGALVLLVLLALGGTFAVLTASGTSAAATVRTVPVGRGTVTETVTAAGTVTSASTSTVNAPAGGTIASVRVALGDRVARGDTLLTLDGESARASLRAARSQLTAARGQLTAATDARDAGTGTAAAGTAAAGTPAAGTGGAGASSAGTAAGAASPAGTPAAGTGGATGTGGTAGTWTGGTGTGGTSAGTPTGGTPTGGTATGSTGTGGTATGSTGTGGTGSGASTSSTSAADAQVAQARASVAQAQSQVVTAENAAEDLTVTAPQDGTVVSLDARVGQTAGAGATTTTSGAGASGGAGSSGSSAAGAGAAAAGAAGAGAGGSAAASAAGGGTSLVTVADLDGLEVRADVPELDVARIATGQPATVAVNALPGQELPGAVSAVDTLPTTGTSVQYGTAVTLTSAPPGLRPGMSASVSVIVRRASDTPFLPSVAVTPIGGPGGTSATVQVLGADGQARARTVGIGLTSDTTTQVTTGLAPGELVVLPDAGLQPLQRGGPPGTQGGGSDGSGSGGGG